MRLICRTTRWSSGSAPRPSLAEASSPRVFRQSDAEDAERWESARSEIRAGRTTAEATLDSLPRLTDAEARANTWNRGVCEGGDRGASVEGSGFPSALRYGLAQRVVVAVGHGQRTVGCDDHASPEGVDQELTGFEDPG